MTHKASVFHMHIISYINFTSRLLIHSEGTDITCNIHKTDTCTTTKKQYGISTPKTLIPVFAYCTALNLGFASSITMLFLGVIQVSNECVDESPQ